VGSSCVWPGSQFQGLLKAWRADQARRTSGVLGKGPAGQVDDLFGLMDACAV